MHRREFLRGVSGALAFASVGAARPGAAHPGAYRPLGSVPIPNAKEAVPGPDGEIVYVATTAGFATVDVRVPSDPQLLAERRNLFSDRETGPLRLIQDVSVEGDRLILAGPANPLRGEVLQGMVVYDVSDPATPVQVAFHETDFPIHNCRLSDGFAYLTGNDGERNPLVVMDVRDGDPTEVARWSHVDHDERWAEVPSGLRTLHDVWVRDGLAVLAHWDAGTYLLDVTDPTNPTFVTRIGGRSPDELGAIADQTARAEVLRLPGNDHYGMTSDGGTLLAINGESWAVGDEGGPGGIELWDVADAANPTRLATIEAPSAADESVGGTWTTSHNFDVVDGRLFSSWYQGGVKIHDVSDPANPEELAWWRDPEETSFWTAKRATEEVFVASSMGRRSNGKGGLYTFPNHAGQQKDPPELTTTESTGTFDATQAGNVSRAKTTTQASSSAQTGDDATAPTTEQAVAGNTTTVSSSDAPGFGIPATLLALLGAGAWRHLRD